MAFYFYGLFFLPSYWCFGHGSILAAYRQPLCLHYFFLLSSLAWAYFANRMERNQRGPLQVQQSHLTFYFTSTEYTERKINMDGCFTAQPRRTVLMSGLRARAPKKQSGGHARHFSCSDCIWLSLLVLLFLFLLRCGEFYLAKAWRALNFYLRMKTVQLHQIKTWACEQVTMRVKSDVLFTWPRCLHLQADHDVEVNPLNCRLERRDCRGT